MDYTNGIISVNNVAINNFLDSKGIEMRGTCTVPDVSASLNTVILIDTARAQVDIVAL